jgi:hypothetical protein
MFKPQDRVANVQESRLIFKPCNSSIQYTCSNDWWQANYDILWCCIFFRLHPRIHCPQRFRCPISIKRMKLTYVYSYLFFSVNLTFVYILYIYNSVKLTCMYINYISNSMSNIHKTDERVNLQISVTVKLLWFSGKEIIYACKYGSEGCEEWPIMTSGS